MTDETRPELNESLSGTEFLRWYWLKDELTAFARRLGIRSSGDKKLITQRIAARLDGADFVEPERASKTGGKQLVAPLTAASVVPVGQRCSQVVRAWFVEQVGPSFSFDAEMRGFFAGADGTQTLQDALDHYLATRGQGPKRIDEQFEYNRFTRDWYAANPSGDRADLLRAWQVYRALPVDERG